MADLVDGSAMEFDLEAGYTVHAGDDIAFAFPYAAPWGYALHFDLEADYTLPAGDELWFGGAPDEPEPPIDPNEPYFPPDGDRLRFNLVGGYAPPLGNELWFGGKIIPPPEPPETPAVPLPYNAQSIEWERTKPRDSRVASGWGLERFLTISVGSAWGYAKDLHVVAGSSWGKLTVVDRAYNSFWAIDADRFTQRESAWKGTKPRDIIRGSAWYGPADLQTVASKCPWLRPPKKDVVFGFAYFGKLNWRDKQTESSWVLATPVDTPHRTYWGQEYYDLICVRDYQYPAGDGLHFNLDQDLSDTNDSDHLHFNFSRNTYDERCNQQEPTGWRDAYTYIKPPHLPRGLTLRTYIMMSSAQITKIAGNVPIPVKSFSMSLDWDSLHWSISATVVGGDVRDLSPTDDGPVEIEAKINGVAWKCVIDEWSRNFSFGSEGRSIKGRGATAILGPPWAQVVTGLQDETRSAVQLMGDQLEYTGWTIDASKITDWNLPAGTLEMKGESPLATIGKIAGACGAFVQPKTEDKELVIHPRYKVAPWDLTRLNCDLVLPANMVVRDNASWDGRTEANSCYISGGISVFAKIEGTAGDKPTADINDALITEVAAGRGRAIYEIGKCGKWQKHSLSLPLFDTTTNEDAIPGLILPGMIVGVDDDDSWQGYVTGVTVKADWGGGGLVVRQEISIERYVGE